MTDRELLGAAARAAGLSLNQLLCANCNFGKLMNGGICPHQGGARHA